MYNKKGDFGFPLYFVPSLVLLILFLLFFSILFFVLDVAKSKDNVVSNELFTDSLTLRNLLLTEENNENIADIISDLPDDSALIKLKSRIPNILKVIPKPHSVSSWNFIISNDQEILHLGEDYPFSKVYYNQTLLLPIKSKNSVVVSLYLNCGGCNE